MTGPVVVGPLSLVLAGLSLVLSGWLLPASEARTEERPIYPPVPASYEDVDIYLLTIGRGSAPYALYGHTIIRVLNHKTGRDYNFNWGIFDFHKSGFIFDFYGGRLDYTMSVSPFRAIVRQYKHFEKRGMVQNKINLTSAQKRTFVEKVRWFQRPENIYFRYQFFYKNCATIPRDFFDLAVGGQIKARTAEVNSGRTFRDLLRKSSRAAAWVYLPVDFSTNSSHDALASHWYEMFLPAKLQAHLAALPAFDDEGQAIPMSRLLGKPKVIIAIPDPDDQWNPYWLVFFVFLIPLVVQGLLVARSNAKEVGAWQNRMFGVSLCAINLWTGFWGCLILSNWLFSGHPDGDANANLWMVWPLDFFVAWFGSILVFGRDPTRFLMKWKNLLMTIAIGHCVGVVVLAILRGTGGVSQEVWYPLFAYGIMVFCANANLIRYLLLKSQREGR